MIILLICLPRQTYHKSLLIAESNNQPLGFIHARTHQDSISNETCVTIPLLAVLPQAQGLGVGKQLITKVEHWAKSLVVDCCI